MTKYEYVVTSCTDRNILLVGKFNNEKDAFKAMIRDFVVFHNEMDALKELYEAVKQTELPDKEYTVDEVVNEILSLTGNGYGGIEEQPDSMSIYSFLITGQECWSNLNKRDTTYDCKISRVEQEEPELIVDATLKSKENMTFFIGEESASGIFCNAWDEFVAYLYDAYLERMRNGETQFNVTIEHTVEVPKTKKVVLFERFARICGYSYPTLLEANNGYGCKHPAQEKRKARFEVTMISDEFPNSENTFVIWDNIREEYYADTFGKVWTYPTEERAQMGLLRVERIEGNTDSCGCCCCHSCPLGIEAKQCDKDDPEYAEKVDWGGFCEDGKVIEGKYLLIDCGSDATDEQKNALERWESYQHRYN